MSKLIPLTQGKSAIVDDDVFKSLNSELWYYDNTTGYARQSHPAILMHRAILNPGRFEVDHINNNKLDNRRCNLRIVTHQQNTINVSKRGGTSSSYKGVCWNKYHQKWMANLQLNHKRYFIGLYHSELEAARAYNMKAVELFGQFAKLNEV